MIEANAFFKKFKDEKIFADALDESVEELAQLFESEVKRRTPVITGRLKGSMVGQRTGVMQGQVSTNVEYAERVEFGYGMGFPRAMVRNGAEAMKIIGVDFLKKKLKDLL